MNQYELEGMWVEGALSGVDYRFSDMILIKRGDHAGEVARVVALIGIDPVPIYGVEFKAGNSAVVEQSNLERAV